MAVLPRSTGFRNLLVNPCTSALKLTAKVRYRQSDQACTLEQTSDGYRAVFEVPQRAVTPGQSVVFYDGEVCLGSGVIEQAEPWFEAEHEQAG